MRKIIGAAAFVAIAFTALPASAQPSDPYDYPYCLQGKDYGPPGVVSVHKLPAVPGYGLRDIFVLWTEPSICVCVWMAAAGPTTLLGTVIEPLATRVSKVRPSGSLHCKLIE